jgi:cbb3-type cytochrome oxidase maturation protein
MDILYLLVPLSVLIVFAILVGFWWALNGGQLDNVEREGQRILMDDENSRLDSGQESQVVSKVDGDQVAFKGRAE